MKKLNETRAFAGLFVGSVLALAAGCTAGAMPDDSAANGDAGEVPACESGCETGVQQSPEQARTVCEASVMGPRLLRRLTAVEVVATLEDIFPEAAAQWTSRLSVDIGSKLGFSNDAATLLVSGSTAKELLKTVESLGDAISSDAVLGTVLPCGLDAADEACAREFIAARGMRLFRRPPTDDEIGRYLAYQQSVAGRSDFKMSIKWLTVALAQSPHAIYRSELGELADDGTYALTQYERASELAYVYSGSTPDQKLLDAAAAGELSSGEELRAQAQRLLAEHPRYLDSIGNFFYEWLEYGKVRGQSRVEAADFADRVSVDMIEETRLFLNTLVFGDLGGVHELMTANYTGMNGRLSELYGYGDLAEDSGFVRVTRPEGRGLGILAHGSLLAGTSHQDSTSPTLRGLLFYRRFLCNTKPKPPDIVPPIEEASGVADAKTTRQKFEEHHSLGACGACHKPFEPYGYTMEQFDEMGRYRADEDGNAIDTTAEVLLNDGSRTELKSLDELALLVDENDDIENCMSGLLAAYMFSGAGGQHCLAEPERRQLASGEISIKDFYVKLTQAPHFTQRRTVGAATTEP